MRATKRIVVTQLILIVIALSTVMAGEPTEVYTFEDCTDISINVVTGYIEMCTYDGDKLVIEYRNELQKPDILTPEVTCESGNLSIREIITENDPEGSSYWTIQIPRHSHLGSIDCLSSLGDIEITEIDANHIKAHAATGEINTTGIDVKGVTLSTSSGDIHISKSQISQEAKLTTADGVIDFAVARLPKKLDAASTFGRVVLTVPTFGNNFTMEISKNAGKGQVVMPFKCTSVETKKFHENDTYETDKCTVSQGTGGYDIKLLTGEGTIEIATDDPRK